MEGYKEKEVITNMEHNMTEAEKLALIKKELFDGFNLDDVTWIAEGDRRELMLMHAERILGLKPNGEAARYYASEIYGEKLDRTDRGSFLYAPHEDVDGWISDLMKLLACFLDNNPWGHCFSLRWISGHFDADNGDDPNQFSPQNEQLLVWLERTVDRRIAALVGKMVESVAELESQKISVAIYDYYVDMLNHYRKLDCANVDECNEYVDSLLESISDVERHMNKGRAMGLSTEEIGLIDSLWCEIPHNYPSGYVAAAKEIWQKIKAVRDNFADGRKTHDDCELFINDMVKNALPIAEKHGVDMELDDEHSLPLSYLKYWLDSIYYGDDSHFE